jgi:hypothetical protein
LVCIAASSNPTNLESVVTAVSRGEFDIRKVATLYRCDKSKIWRHLHGQTAHSHVGRTQVVREDEERDLARCCQVLAEFRICADRNVVGKVIKDYLEASCR